MVANWIPTQNWCQATTRNDIGGLLRMSTVTSIVIEWCYDVITKHVRDKHLLVYTVFTTLFYRCLEKIKSTSTAQMYGAAAVYLAASVSVETGVTISELVCVGDGAFTKKELEGAIARLIVDMNGVIRIPSVFDVTDNALEILWWVQQVQKDCTYLEKSPQECHDQYGILETNKPELLATRIHKDLVISVKLNVNKKCIITYYASFKDYSEGKDPKMLGPPLTIF
jgi:hypothetical protein